jgi:hypothetical protein
MLVSEVLILASDPMEKKNSHKCESQVHLWLILMALFPFVSKSSCQVVER